MYHVSERLSNGHVQRGVRTIFARLQGEDKPSPLLWTMLRPARSIVGAMACPRPAWAAASFARTCARCKNRTRTPCFGIGTYIDVAVLYYFHAARLSDNKRSYGGRADDEHAGGTVSLYSHGLPERYG